MIYIGTVILILLHVNMSKESPGNGYGQGGFGNMGQTQSVNKFGLGKRTQSSGGSGGLFQQSFMPSPVIDKSPKCLDPTSFQVMDFNVPQYPHKGDDMELTCGYSQQTSLEFESLEWFRDQGPGTKEGLFFKYTNGRSYVSSESGWISRKQVSFLLKGDGWKTKLSDQHPHNVLTLRLHSVSDRMTGRYKCKIFMKKICKPESGKIDASRITQVKVVEKNDPESYDPQLVITNSSSDHLICTAVGVPAPQLVWAEDVGGELTFMNLDLLEYSPLRTDPEGFERAMVRLSMVTQGLFVCRAILRNGDYIQAHVEVDSDFNVDILGKTTEQPPVPEPEPDYFWIIFICSCIGSGFIFFCLCLCCICCRRRRLQTRRRQKALERLQEERQKGQASVLYTGWQGQSRRSRIQSRSASRRSMKKKAPCPDPYSTDTLSID